MSNLSHQFFLVTESLIVRRASLQIQSNKERSLLDHDKRGVEQGVAPENLGWLGALCLVSCFHCLVRCMNDKPPAWPSLLVMELQCFRVSSISLFFFLSRSTSRTHIVLYSWVKYRTWCKG